MNFEIRRDTIETTPLLIKDDEYLYICGEGIHHEWNRTKTQLTNAEYIIDSPATEDFPEYGHWECRLCQEELPLPYKVNGYRNFMPGLTTYYIDGKPVDKNTFETEYKKVIPV
jgi:hypothetical protein